MPPVDTVQVPNRSLFRQSEVCEIAQVQSYVLRSWEAEFPDLGVAKTPGTPRVYRRADLERVLRLRHLLFVEGLTLAGARRRFMEEKAPPDADQTPLDDLLKSDARERILHVRQMLRELATMLAATPGTETLGEAEFTLAAAAQKPRGNGRAGSLAKGTAVLTKGVPRRKAARTTKAAHTKSATKRKATGR